MLKIENYNKNYFIILVAAGLQILASFLLFSTLFLKNLNFVFFENSAAASLAFFAPPLILWWTGCGQICGMVFLMLASLAALFLSAFSENYIFNFNLLLYLGAGALSHLWYHRTKIHISRQKTRSEELEEMANTLKDNLKKQIELTDSLKKRATKYSSLKNVTEQLGSVLSMDAVSKYVAEEAFGLVGKTDTCLLYLIDETKQELSLTAAKSTKIIKPKKGDIFDLWVLKQRKPLIVEDVNKDFRFSIEKQKEYMRDFRSLISAPLVTEKRVLGVLRLDSINANSYTQDDLRFLDIISDLAAVAISNCKLYEKTEELAIKDGLTGLYVHRYFKQRLDEEVQRAARTKSCASVIILDIDRFKNYNDRYGHTAGDLVLRNVAMLLKQSTGPGDIVSRYGGEEFAVVLPGINKEDALRSAERIRKSVESAVFMLRREKTNVTVSLGLSEYPKDTLTRDDLLRIADVRLYKAKESGRNRVCAD